MAVTEVVSLQPLGPFDLLNQNRYFNGWPVSRSGRVIMTFPVEGSWDVAAMALSQDNSGEIQIEVRAKAASLERAARQAAAAVSLDEDGRGWPQVGRDDPVIGELQQQFGLLRPSLFHSPYEAASAFVIGHRISIAQARKLRSALSAQFGTSTEIDGQEFSAFPSPDQLLGIEGFAGLGAVKVERLHAVAEAALAGWLDRYELRRLEAAAALEQLQTLPGIGPFFAQGILYRGAGLADAVTTDEMTSKAIRSAYNTSVERTAEDLTALTQTWRPYRMWGVVLLHLWFRQAGSGDARLGDQARIS